PAIAGRTRPRGCCASAQSSASPAPGCRLVERPARFTERRACSALREGSESRIHARRAMDQNATQNLPEGVTQECQSPSGSADVPGLPDGYQAQLAPDGSGTEIIPPAPAGQKDDIRVLTVWCL